MSLHNVGGGMESTVWLLNLSPFPSGSSSGKWCQVLVGGAFSDNNVSLVDHDAFAAPPADALVQQLVEKGQLFK